MSLLSICTLVAQDLPLEVPATIVGNDDETATRLLAAAQLTGEALARKPQGGWVSMIREFDITTSAIATQSGTIANTALGGWAQITVPNVLGIDSTWYAFGTGLPNNTKVTSVANGVVTLNQVADVTGLARSAGFSGFSSGFSSGFGPLGYAGSFSFGKADFALPSDFERVIDNTMWDRSRYWQMRGPMSPQQWQLYKSSYIGNATIQRRYRFLRVGSTTQFAVDPVPTDAGSSLVFEYVSNAWCQSASGTPQTRWAADTDTGILDEYLITLGVRWRMLRRLGMSYNEELDEYEREVIKAIAHDGGGATLSIVPQYPNFLLGPMNVQEGSFPSA